MRMKTYTLASRQSGVKVPPMIYCAAAAINGGAGAASEVISGKRNAYDVRTTIRTQFKMPVTIDLSAYGLAY